MKSHQNNQELPASPADAEDHKDDTITTEDLQRMLATAESAEGGIGPMECKTDSKSAVLPPRA